MSRHGIDGTGSSSFDPHSNPSSHRLGRLSYPPISTSVLLFLISGTTPHRTHSIAVRGKSFQAWSKALLREYIGAACAGSSHSPHCWAANQEHTGRKRESSVWYCGRCSSTVYNSEGAQHPRRAPTDVSASAIGEVKYVLHLYTQTLSFYVCPFSLCSICSVPLLFMQLPSRCAPFFHFLCCLPIIHSHKRGTRSSIKVQCPRSKILP